MWREREGGHNQPQKAGMDVLEAVAGSVTVSVLFKVLFVCFSASNE